MRDQSPPRPARRGLTALLLLAVAHVIGCGGSEPEIPEEYLLVPDRPEAAEVDFGSYVIPIPNQNPATRAAFGTRNYMQLQFVLFGIVDPEDESSARRLAERHRSELRDRVIKTCRNTSPGELQDPELLTLKLRLVDATQPVFEGVTFQTLLVRDLMIEAL